MGLKGAAIGCFAGWFIGGGPLGSLLGSFIGSWLENKTSGKSRTKSQQSRVGGGASGRDLMFCASAAALLGKMAKSDGVITRHEINAVEIAFRRLGFSKVARDYACNVFRKAKDDKHTVYEYAYDFAKSMPSVEIRELMYELLWDVACADGTVTSQELVILRQIPLSMGIRPAWFEYYARERLSGYRQRQYRQHAVPERDLLAESYEMIGASASDDDATLKRKYRDLAKKYHPDALRAQGLPDEMIGKANERMAKINSAWSEIKSARGL